MVSLYDSGIIWLTALKSYRNQRAERVKKLTGKDADQASARKGTIAYSTSGGPQYIR